MVAVGHRPILGNDHRKPPAVNAAVPFAVSRAADLSIQPDVRGDDIAVGDHPFPPGADVLEQPIAIFPLAGEHGGIHRQRGRQQVERVIADDVVVILEVGDHLFVACLAVSEIEAVFDLNWIAGPIEAGRLSQQRSAASVEQALDDAMLRVVVRRAGIFVHVEAGESPHALLEGDIVRIGESL